VLLIQWSEALRENQARQAPIGGPARSGSCSSTNLPIPAKNTVHAVLDRYDLVKRARQRRGRAEGTPLSNAIRGHEFASFLALVLKKALDRISALGLLVRHPRRSRCAERN
jgi:hypothetical protein